MLERLVSIFKYKEFQMSILLMFLIEILFIASVILKDGDIKDYLLLLFPQLLLIVVTLIWSYYIDASRFFVICCSVLFLIGIAMQCILPSEGATYNAIKAIIILVCSFLLACFSLWFYKNILPRIDVLWIMRISVGITLIIYALLFLFGKGPEQSPDTKAWIFIAGQSLQLTEFIKIFVILYLSALFCESRFSDIKKIIFGCLYMALNAVGSLLIHEMGSLLIMGVIFVVYCFLFLDSTKLLCTLVVALVFAGGIVAFIGAMIYLKKDIFCTYNGLVGKMFQHLISNVENIKQRMNIWLNPLSDPSGSGYQGIKAMGAMAIGGFLGSNYKIYVPEGESDYIFVSLLLHMGYVIGALVVIIFIGMLVWGIKMYLRAEGDMETGIIAGIIFYIVAQAFLMIFGSTGFFIMTGIPIPFLSAGGTANMVTFIFTALILYLTSSGYQSIYWKSKMLYADYESQDKKHIADFFGKRGKL